VTLVVRAVFWVVAYLGAVLAPLVFAAIGAGQPDHGFWTNLSVALGFTGLAMMGLEFALVARFRPVAAPFGQDALLQFHRQIGSVGLLFVLVHFAIRRRTLRLSYEAWHALHTVLAVVLVGGGLGHILFVDEYVDRWWKQVLWSAMAVAFVSLLVWVRLIKPRQSLARPWRPVRVTPERGATRTLTLKPVVHVLERPPAGWAGERGR
jgi:predicted ferric reductase